MQRNALYQLILLSGMVVGLASPSAAAAPQPMEVLRAGVDQGLATLNAPPCQTPDCYTSKEERLWQLSQELFDYTTMSRQILSANWKNFTPEQQAAFVREFAEYLRRTYLPLLMRRYSGQQIKYVRQVRLSPSRVRVDAHVLWRGREIPLSAKMIHRDGTWKIYDVSPFGISTVMNYRAQFRWMLLNETPDQVIDLLRKKNRPRALTIFSPDTIPRRHFALLHHPPYWMRQNLTMSPSDPRPIRPATSR
jgi:ABC-type transporter MlaC component